MPLSWWELILILLVLLLVFGAKRLPEMGRSMGKGMREFKDAVTGVEKEPDDSLHELPSAAPDSTVSEHADEKERETVS